VSALSLSEQVETIRKAIGITRLDGHVTVLRVGGAGAFAVLDAVCPGALFLRENQMRHTLLLSPDAHPVADVYVCADDQEFLVLAQGLSAVGLVEYLQEHRAARAADVTITTEDLGSSNSLFSINGPYAWELAAALLGPEVNGIPYLSFLRRGDAICFRAGATGEYGFDVLVPKAQADATWQRMQELGEPLGAKEVGVEALDHCSLENWYFSIRTLHGAPKGTVLTPLELQLQWRVSYEKEFVGSEALRARREAGSLRRATAFTSPTPVAAGQRVLYDGREIGTVLVATTSCTRGDGLGIALIDRDLAHPGIDRFVVDAPGGPVAMLTRTPPLINNRSLHVDPNRHSGRTRETDAFPPLFVS
jgi:glycine cleavage system aminomethyltransferase T